MMRPMRLGRFVLVVLATATAITILGHLVSDFDLPDDPNDTIRGIGIWVVAVLVATLDASYTRKKSR
jgi:hypothetical protein